MESFGQKSVLRLVDTHAHNHHPFSLEGWNHAFFVSTQFFKSNHMIDKTRIPVLQGDYSSG